MYFNEGRCEFFDSFGRRPMPTFERYMNRLVESGCITIISYSLLFLDFVDIIVFGIVLRKVKTLL